MKTITIELNSEMANLLVDTLQDSFDCGDDEYPYKSKELKELVDVIFKSVEEQK